MGYEKGGCLKIINSVNGANVLLEKYIKQTKEDFKTDLVAVMMGIAYGGDVEMCAKLWGDKGKVYGFDTFEDLHPRHLAKRDTDFEATCMQYWYDTMGTDTLSLEYQTNQLKEMGLTNAHLIKGEVKVDSCEFLDKIHLAWLDMDLIESMRTGYQAVKDKLVKGGYLCLHDVVPRYHIAGLYELFYGEYFNDDEWEELERVNTAMFTVWRKK